MKVDPKILLVNPPIYDFAAYDYWLKPLGLLTIAGMIAHSAELEMFDFLDRADSFYEDKPKYKSGRFGTGRFFSEKIPTPEPLQNIPRHYRRFGASTSKFVEYLETSAQHDYAMIQTVMTYWYPGYKEVIETIRSVSPATKIILGGPYALICPAHAKSLGADFTVDEPGLNNLFNYLKIAPARDLPPRWQVYKRLESASMRLTTGCPFKCTYCSVPSIYGKFATLPIDKKLAELEAIVSLGVKNIAF